MLKLLLRCAAGQRRQLERTPGELPLHPEPCARSWQQSHLECCIPSVVACDWCVTDVSQHLLCRRCSICSASASSTCWPASLQTEQRAGQLLRRLPQPHQLKGIHWSSYGLVPNIGHHIVSVEAAASVKFFLGLLQHARQRVDDRQLEISQKTQEVELLLFCCCNAQLGGRFMRCHVEWWRNIDRKLFNRIQSTCICCASYVY